MSIEQICYCSFCGKNQFEVSKIIAGPLVFICNNCVDICANIIETESPRKMLAEDIGLRPPTPDAECLGYAKATSYERYGISWHLLEAKGQDTLLSEARTMLKAASSYYA